MMNPPRLQPGHFAKFQLETLMYVFYSMPGDEAQVFAADELAVRGWWFHKEFKARARHSNLTQKHVCSTPKSRSHVKLLRNIWSCCVVWSVCEQ